MDVNKIKKLESNNKLKKKIYGKGIWKSYSFIPPTLVLFVGILGIVYLLQTDRLLTWHSVPFFAIFIIGTVWFKATKKYLVEKRISEAKYFLICHSIPLVKKDKDTIFIFSTGNNRNNKYYLEKEKKDILEEYPNFDFVNIKNKAIKLEEENLYLTIPSSLKKVTSKGGSQSADGYWLVYSDGGNVDFLTADELNRYAQ